MFWVDRLGFAMFARGGGVVSRRTTFYGADELGVREPGGHSILFARLAEGPAS